MRFPVLIKHEELGYVATEISSGVASQGDTVEEAMAMLKEALELYYEDNDPGEADTTNCFLTTMEVSV